MKHLRIKPDSPSADLAGEEGQSTWVVGRNCIYHASGGFNYRVAIRTRGGWKAYGFFNDLEVASYVANIAILIEDCSEKYELNSVGAKDRLELQEWRQMGSNASIEALARENYEKVLVALELARAEEERGRSERELVRRNASESAYKELTQQHRQVQVQQEQQANDEAAQLRDISTAELLKALQRDIPGSQSRAIRAALEKRGFVRRAI